MSPPDNEFPAAVELAALLGRTDDVAVGVTRFVVFSTGFQFALAVRVRTARPEFILGGLHMRIGSHPHPGVELPLEERLLLGLEYADGRRASTLGDIRTLIASPSGGEADLVLFQQGGGGDDRSVEHDYWVAPLPPDGPVTFVLAWPAFGMPEARTVLPGDIIRAAADRSQLLWPPQPPAEPLRRTPPPRPSTGWFADPSD